VELKVILIVGPTCSGKTAVGLKIATELKSEIISADSRQIYKFLNIGTAKPTNEELKLVKHHFVDLLEPTEDFNVSKFEKESLKIINNLHHKNKIPIVIGGSGLYLKAIVDGIFDEVDTDDNYRSELLENRKNFGNEFIYQKLKDVDLQTASNMLPQNWKRVIRALEVFHLTGEPIWKFHEKHKRETNIEFMQFGLNWEREILYKNIETRVDEMIKLGLVNEVKSILSMGISQNINALNTVGYKEIIGYLSGNITFDRSIELIKRNTRRYAKRQLTWFRKDKRINWLDVNSKEDFEKISETIINKVL
jgi:tRNA dimethylallyltransferase